MGHPELGRPCRRPRPVLDISSTEGHTINGGKDKHMVGPDSMEFGLALLLEHTLA